LARWKIGFQNDLSFTNSGWRQLQYNLLLIGCVTSLFSFCFLCSLGLSCFPSWCKFLFWTPFCTFLSLIYMKKWHLGVFSYGKGVKKNLFKINIYIPKNCLKFRLNLLIHFFRKAWWRLRRIFAVVVLWKLGTGKALDFGRILG
jgi:hypothetical protein